MKLMIIDGNSIANRAFYGIRLLSTRDGQYTNAVYGFLTILNKLMDEEAPQAVCVAFDTAAPTFRHTAYEGYKAQRKEMPQELASQMPVLKKVLSAMNIPCYQLEGYEADDIIGFAGEKCGKAGWNCVIVTGDRDSLQLVSDNVNVRLVTTKAGQTLTTLYDVEKFWQDYGFVPDGLVDLKGLMGDSSDNIPGVSGIGEKTAMALVQRFGDIRGIYENLDSPEIKEAVRKKLEAGRDMAKLSRNLAVIEKNVPIDFKPEDNIVSQPDNKALYELFLSLEFSKLISQMRLDGVSEAKPEELKALETVLLTGGDELSSLIEKIGDKTVFIEAAPQFQAVAVILEEKAYVAVRDDFTDKTYMEFLTKLFGHLVKKCCYENKALMRELMYLGVEPGGFIFDTSLAAYVLNPSESGYTLERTALSYLQVQLPDKKNFASDNAFSPLSDKSAAADCLVRHTQAIAALYSRLAPEIDAGEFADLYYNVELALCRVLADMEHAGVGIDRKTLTEFGQILARRINDCQSLIYQYAGEEFNINSTKKLGQILFDRLGLPVVKKTKTGYSTDIEVLEKLRGRHEIVELIIDYRTLTKLKSTYADGLLKVIAHDGRIHTSFNMTATATGRLSSTEPNLQNIPVRTDLGSEIRKMFVPGPGNVLVDADYSQIELRVLAHISGDEAMIAAFRDGEDIHTVTAGQVFGVDANNVTPLMRRHAKAVNFGIVYGISDYSLSEDIGVTVREAKSYIESYLEKYHGVRQYMTDIVKQAREAGYVSTLMNRRRYLPEIHSKNYNIRSGAERMALNTPIQGSAADIIKLAMIRVYDRLKRESLKSRLVLQVHDELIVEAPQAEAETVKKLLTEEMEGVMKLKAPLVAEANCGLNWYEAK